MLRSSEIKPLFVDLSLCDKSFLFFMSFLFRSNMKQLLFFQCAPVQFAYEITWKIIFIVPLYCTHIEKDRSCFFFFHFFLSNAYDENCVFFFLFSTMHCALTQSLTFIWRQLNCCLSHSQPCPVDRFYLTSVKLYTDKSQAQRAVCTKYLFFCN